jgi:hypothetical protein
VIQQPSAAAVSQLLGNPLTPEQDNDMTFTAAEEKSSQCHAQCTRGGSSCSNHVQSRQGHSSLLHLGKPSRKSLHMHTTGHASCEYMEHMLACHVCCTKDKATNVSWKLQKAARNQPHRTQTPNESQNTQHAAHRQYAAHMAPYLRCNTHKAGTTTNTVNACVPNVQGTALCSGYPSRSRQRRYLIVSP